MGTTVRHRLRTWVDLVAGSAARKALLAGGLRRAAEDPPWCRRRSDSSFRVDADDAVQQGLEHICEQQSGTGRGSWGHLGGGSVLGIRQGGGRIAVDHGSQWCQALRMMRLHAAGMRLSPSTGGVGARLTSLRGGGRGLAQDFRDFHDSTRPTAVRTFKLWIRVWRSHKWGYYMSHLHV